MAPAKTFLLAASALMSERAKAQKVSGNIATRSPRN